ncbi:hydrogenase, partial [bacterium]|nr:hydrogenase [bacterium]
MVTTAIREIDNTTNDPGHRTNLITGDNNFTTVTEKVCSIVEDPKTSQTWFVMFGVSLSFLGVLGLMIAYLFWIGVGVWGV